MSRAALGMLAFVESGLPLLWLGAALFFVAVVAPAAFAVGPTPSAAGVLVGRVLPPLFTSGIIVGGAIVAMELRWPRAGRRRIAAGGSMLTACAIAQFLIGGQIHRLRAAAGQPIETLQRVDPRRLAFGRLHALSVVALGAAMIAAATAAGPSRALLATRS